MFIGREYELNELNKYYKRKQFQFIILYGRRRVGKTYLIKKFIENKKTIFFSAEESTDYVNLRKISDQLNEFMGFGGNTIQQSWEDVFNSIADISKKEKIILVIDEFPYIQQSNKGFMSILQHSIDHRLKDTEVMIIASGSSISFMENEMIAHRSPLYGRITGQIFLKPFDYFDASKFFDNFTYEEKIEAYCILGGIPQYLNKFDDRKSIKENIIEYILNPSEELFEVPMNTLKQELRSPAIYNSIIETIASGSSRSNEISTKIGVPATTILKYIETLMRLHIIKRETPILSNTKKKTIYSIDDHLFKFIHAYVYRYRSLIEIGMGEAVFEKKIKDDYYKYIGLNFERVCLEYLIRENKNLKLPFLVEEFGRWWGGNPITKKEEEIDIVGIDKNNGLYVECKYRNEKFKLNQLKELIQKSNLVYRNNKYYYIFSKNEYSKDLKDYAIQMSNVKLIGLRDLFEI
ncbi:MAG: ATP-binding protein [Bacillota bacterium]|nr:ATP-binding protein [Bacillota bacterium]